MPILALILTCLTLLSSEPQEAPSRAFCDVTEASQEVLYKPVPVAGITLCIDEFQKVLKEQLEEDNRVYMSQKRKMTFEWSKEDLYWFYKCVQAEESINTHRGKYLTACCILNRARLGWADGTLKGVIFQKNQFAVTRNGRIEKAEPDEDTIIACNEALDNCEEWVIAFGHGDIHSKWATLVEYTEVGEYYYKEK